MSSSTAIHTPWLKRIAIVGAGMTGWTVAAGLVNGLRGLNIEIILIDDSTLSERDSTSEVTTPSLRAFHHLLGIDEKDFIAKTGASYTLATEYAGWSQDTQQYFLPFSDHGFMLQGIEFSQYFLSQKTADSYFDYDAYSLSAIAAKLGRFRHPAEDQASLFSTLNYGFQIPCTTYTQYLKQYATALGVKHIITSLMGAGVSSETGAIDYVIASNNIAAIDLATSEEKIYADFFIDCSGEQAWLMSKIYQLAYETNTSLLTNASISITKETTSDSGNTAPFARLSLAPAGWYQKIHTQKHTSIHYFFSEQHSTREQAFDWLCQGIQSASENNVIMQNHLTGKRQKFWHKNCIAMGSAASNAETFSIGKLHFVQSAVLRFLVLFPALPNVVTQADEYNRLTDLEFAHVADFHSLHYQLAKPSNAPFWLSAKSAAISVRLAHKLTLFKERGRIPFYENETLSSGIWISLLLGCGVHPTTYDPMVDSVDPSWVVSQLSKMKSMIASAANSMPEHKHYLKNLSST